MKALILFATVLDLSSFANASSRIDCRFQHNGVDQGMGLTLTEKTCDIGNGYTHADYVATVSHEGAATIFTCQNIRQWSAYPATLIVTIQNGQAKIQDSSNSYRTGTITCK